MNTNDVCPFKCPISLSTSKPAQDKKNLKLFADFVDERYSLFSEARALSEQIVALRASIEAEQAAFDVEVLRKHNKIERFTRLHEVVCTYHMQALENHPQRGESLNDKRLFTEDLLKDIRRGWVSEDDGRLILANLCNVKFFQDRNVPVDPADVWDEIAYNISPVVQRGNRKL